MRQVADSDPSQIEQDLTNLAEACAAQAEAYDNLKENLDLIQPRKKLLLAPKLRPLATTPKHLSALLMKPLNSWQRRLVKLTIAWMNKPVL